MHIDKREANVRAHRRVRWCGGF